MDQFRAEWKNIKRDLERQMALLGPPSEMRTTDENGKETTKGSKACLGRIIKELDQLLKVHEAHGAEGEKHHVRHAFDISEDRSNLAASSPKES